MAKRIKLRKEEIVSKNRKVIAKCYLTSDTNRFAESKTELPSSGSAETTWCESSYLGKRKAETDLTLGDWESETKMDVASSMARNGFPRAPDNVLENRRIVRGQRRIPHRNVEIRCTTKSTQHKKTNPFEQQTTKGKKRKECPPVSSKRVFVGGSATGTAGYMFLNNTKDWMPYETIGMHKKCKRSNDSKFDIDDTTTTDYDGSSISVPPSHDIPASSFTCLPALEGNGHVTPPRAACRPLRREGGQRRVSFASLVKVREHKLRIGDPRLCERLSREKKPVCKVLPVELGNEVEREYFVPTPQGRKEKKFGGKRRARRVKTSDEQMERLEDNGVDILDVLEALHKCLDGRSQVKRAYDASDQSAKDFVDCPGRQEYKESCRKARTDYLKARGFGEKVSSWNQEAFMHSYYQVRCGVTASQRKAVLRAERQQKLLDMEKSK